MSPRAPVDPAAIEVGPPRPEEIAEAVAVTARAMHTSPMAYAVIGESAERRYRDTHRLFTQLYRLAHGQRPLVARLGGRIVGATNDLVDGGCRPDALTMVRSLPALAACGPRTALRSLRWMTDWERRDPERPHAHFGPFGVEPSMQGSGIGSLVLRHYTEALDAAGEDSYLETEKPQNVALYGRFGFEVIDTAEYRGVPNWFMWRAAGTDSPGSPRPGALI